LGPEAISITEKCGSCPIHYALKDEPWMPFKIIEQNGTD